MPRRSVSTIPHGDLSGSFRLHRPIGRRGSKVVTRKSLPVPSLKQMTDGKNSWKKQIHIYFPLFELSPASASIPKKGLWIEVPFVNEDDGQKCQDQAETSESSLDEQEAMRSEPVDDESQ